MKNLDSLNNSWDRSITKDSSLMTVPGANKKFKRKSREPKRLFSDPKPENLKNYAADMSDGDLVDDIQMDVCSVSRLAPLQRKLMMSQGVMTSTTGIYSTDGNTVPGQSSAIDMRIGINVPATAASKPSPLPVSPFANSEISHWPTAISQPLSNRLKLGLCSTFPLSASNSSSRSRSPKQEVFSLEASLSNQTEVMPVPRAFQTSQCHQHEEARIQSSKDSPTKRVSVNEDGPGRLPEVKAIQQTRRLLANARERTRVHTISAAFEALRKQVPCYSYGQKLSKLAILRIACNYILSLAQLVELDYSPDHSSLSFSQCVDQCTRTLQAEGRSKKRKE